MTFESVKRIFKYMSISRDDVQHVARLARLKLTNDELDKLAGELGQIVHYVETLSKVDTENVIPKSQFIGAENVFRDDIPVDSLPKSEALRNAPKSDQDYFLAPKVIG